MSALRLGVVSVVVGHDLADIGGEFFRQLALRNVSAKVEEGRQLVGLDVELGCQLVVGHFKILSCCSYEEYITALPPACKKCAV